MLEILEVNAILRVKLGRLLGVLEDIAAMPHAHADGDQEVCIPCLAASVLAIEKP